MASAAGHRSSAVWLAAVMAVLVGYASLFPFTGWRWPPGQELTALLVLPWPPWRDDWDLWFNGLGYLPLGGLLFVAGRRSGLGAVAAMALAIVLPALLSYAAEVTQHFLPRRHPSLKDWAMNVAGAAAGALLASAAYALGWVDRWHGMRERWFDRRSAGALTLLALWPFGLLFPTPVPLGLGQVGEPLRELARWALEDVPWADPLADALAATAATPGRITPLAEMTITAFGLLGPCMVAYAVVAPGWRRLVLAAGAAAIAAAGVTLSTMLNFGPQHAAAWWTPLSGASIGAAGLLALMLSPASRRLAAGVGLVVLGGAVALVAQAPADPYFAQNLAAWEQGRFVRFHGLAQWVGWLWPFAAIAWLLGRLARRE